jgi:hypothetical protein
VPGPIRARPARCEAVLALADIKTTHSAFPADEAYGYGRAGTGMTTTTTMTSNPAANPGTRSKT